MSSAVESEAHEPGNSPLTRSHDDSWVAVIVRVLLVLIAMATVGGCVSPSDLIGAWRSDEVKTVAGLHRIEAALTEKQRQLAFRDHFFGQLAVVYRASDAFGISEGRCGPLSAQDVVRHGFRSLEIWYPENGGLKTQVLEFEGDSYWLPLPWAAGAREYFSRVSLDELARAYPCISETLGEHR